MFLRQLRFAFIWAGLILVLCLVPGSVVMQPGFFDKLPVDKVVHALLFGVLYVLLVKGLERQTGYPLLQRHAVLVGFTIAVLYGGATELIQEWMQLGRRGDLADMLANTIGVILGMAYLRWGEVRMMYYRKRWERYF